MRLLYVSPPYRGSIFLLPVESPSHHFTYQVSFFVGSCFFKDDRFSFFFVQCSVTFLALCVFSTCLARSTVRVHIIRAQVSTTNSTRYRQDAKVRATSFPSKQKTSKNAAGCHQPTQGNIFLLPVRSPSLHAVLRSRFLLDRAF